jgi:hypothetical protein
MIKLIVTDMDGTLLDENKEIAEENWEIFRELDRRNILFSVGSGRQYYTLRKTFDRIKDSMLFIADNGSIIFHKDEILHVDSMDRNLVNTIIMELRTIEGITVMLSGVNSAYIEPCHEDVMAEVEHYYERLEIVDDCTTVDDEIIKIAICDLRGAEQNSYPLLQKFNEVVQVVLSGEVWVDMMSLTANKGSAIEKMYGYFSISADESMAFGDYLNDREMLMVVTHSYAMANAHEEIKEIANYKAESNQNNGVGRVIQDYLNS